MNVAHPSLRPAAALLLGALAACGPGAVPRAAVPRADGKIELIGLAREKIRVVLEGAGLEPKQAKLRAKQIWHWIYNRGVTDFALMTDIAKVQQPWLTERFVITRPEVVEAQVAAAHYRWP